MTRSGRASTPLTLLVTVTEANCPRCPQCGRDPSGCTCGQNCSSACVTKDHATFGACMRSKGLYVAPNLSDTGASKRWDSELSAYRDARRQGVQPAGTTMAKVNEAMRLSDSTGVAFQAA
jgi:hypothetical protein